MPVELDVNVVVGEVERVVSTDGTSIAYRRVGRGPRVIAVHGGLGTWRSWLAVARRLADRYELVLVERRGRGDSPDHGVPYALSREVEDLAAVRDQVGPVLALVGHSFGGAVSLELARDVAIGALVVYEPPAGVGGLIPAPVLARIEAHLAAGDPAGALTIGVRQLDAAGLVRADRPPSGASWSRGLLELVPTIARELRAVDGLGTAVDRYATITAPVLVLLGTASPAREQRACTQLAEVLPAGRLALLSGCGHVAHAQAPDHVARAIARFLDELSVSAGSG